MIKISKVEAFKMRELGYDEFIKHSYSKHPTYYLVEEKNDVYNYNKGKKELVRLSALHMLEQYRKGKIKEVRA